MDDFNDGAGPEIVYPENPAYRALWAAGLIERFVYGADVAEHPRVDVKNITGILLPDGGPSLTQQDKFQILQAAGIVFCAMIFNSAAGRTNANTYYYSNQQADADVFAPPADLTWNDNIKYWLATVDGVHAALAGMIDRLDGIDWENLDTGIHTEFYDHDVQILLPHPKRLVDFVNTVHDQCAQAFDAAVATAVAEGITDAGAAYGALVTCQQYDSQLTSSGTIFSNSALYAVIQQRLLAVVKDMMDEAFKLETIFTSKLHRLSLNAAQGAFNKAVIPPLYGLPPGAGSLHLLPGKPDDFSP